MADAADWFALQELSPLAGPPIRFVDLADPGAERAARAMAAGQAIVAGVDAAGALPAIDPAPFDLLLTAATDPPAPWVTGDPRAGRGGGGARTGRGGDAAAGGADRRGAPTRRRRSRSNRWPIPRCSAVRPSGPGWRRADQSTRRRRRIARRLRYARDGASVTLTLDRPETRNATDATMRDALCEALAAVADDPGRPALTAGGGGALLLDRGRAPRVRVCR
ncbi:MAG: hypothetical protein PGN08_06085 [Sphingomonas taxi]